MLYTYNEFGIRRQQRPQGIHPLHVHFTVTGKALAPKRVEQAVHLSAEKYCSASIMLGKTAEITHDSGIIEPDLSVRQT